MSEEGLDYEDTLRALLGIVGKRVSIQIHTPGHQLAVRFGGTLSHANQDEWADKLYEDSGRGPAPEALFFSVNPYAFLPIDVDTEQFYGFAIGRYTFEGGYKVRSVLFIDVGEISLMITPI